MSQNIEHDNSHSYSEEEIDLYLEQLNDEQIKCACPHLSSLSDKRNKCRREYCDLKESINIYSERKKNLDFELKNIENKSKLILTLKRIANIIFVLLFVSIIIYTTSKNSAIINRPLISTYVCYVTKYGDCYHAGGCGYLWKSKIETTVYDAKKRGYRSCSKCTPTEVTFIPEDINYVDAIFAPNDIDQWALRLGGILICMFSFKFLIIEPNKKYKLQIEQEDNLFQKQCSCIYEINNINSKVKENEIHMAEVNKEIFDYKLKREKYTRKLSEQPFLTFIGLNENMRFNEKNQLTGTVQKTDQYCCYITKAGKKFHYLSRCVVGDTLLVPVSEAMDKKYHACGRCTDGHEPLWIYRIEKNLRNALEEMDKYDVVIPNRGYWIG